MISNKNKGARGPGRETGEMSVTPNPRRKIYELHPTNGPCRPSLDAD